MVTFSLFADICGVDNMQKSSGDLYDSELRYSESWVLILEKSSGE